MLTVSLFGEQAGSIGRGGVAGGLLRRQQVLLTRPVAVSERGLSVTSIALASIDKASFSICGRRSLPLSVMVPSATL